MSNADDQHVHDDSRQQAFYDNAFRQLVGSPDLIWLSDTGGLLEAGARSDAGEPDPLGGYVQRIADSILGGVGIDPSVVRFATSRAAVHWGRAEEEVDAMVGDSLLRATAALLTAPR